MARPLSYRIQGDSGGFGGPSTNSGSNDSTTVCHLRCRSVKVSVQRLTPSHPTID